MNNQARCTRLHQLGSGVRLASSYEMLARQRKVDALVAVLREAKITAANIWEAESTELFWQLVASQAQVNLPSETTIAAVLAELEKP